MWTVNQDGLSVVNVEAFSMDLNEVVKLTTKVFHVWGSVHDHDFLMGTYKTYAKAKEVMKDFALAVKKHGNDPTYIYHVPGDDDNDSTEC